MSIDLPSPKKVRCTSRPLRQVLRVSTVYSFLLQTRYKRYCFQGEECHLEGCKRPAFLLSPHSPPPSPRPASYRRCEDMLTRGLLSETADLLVRGLLDPASPAGRAIGYRQAIDFLLQEARLAEPTDTAGETGSSSPDDAPVAADPETRFLDFVLGFAAKTRQYSADQMKWFRSSKGRDFSWQAWDLGGPIEEVRSSASSSSASRAANAPGGAARAAAARARAGDGCDWRGVATSITEKYQLSREAFDEHLNGELQASLREENRKRAGDMKRYATELSLLGGGGLHQEALRNLVRETKELATRIRQQQPERFQNGAETVAEIQGWHAGAR